VTVTELETAGPSIDVDGYFPADSMIRRLHRLRVTAISGVRALLMQACDPLAVVGFDRHSKIFNDPKSRLISTDRNMSRIYFGDEETAERTGRIIRAMHKRVRGEVEEDYGPIAAGTAYSADDPELMLWTLATLADSALVYYEKFVGSLSDDEREAYWADYRKIGRLLGMPDSSIPASEPELRDYVNGRLGDGSLYISGDIARRAKAIIFEPPFTGFTKVAVTPLTEAVKLSSVGLLPKEIRKLYGFSWDPARAVLLESLALQIRIGQRAWPDQIRMHPYARVDTSALAAA
jgi:uncharacterized protein (DUF2236 family)